MKKLTTILLSVLLIASLFVSCDNATKAVQDELAEVALSTQASSRSLTVSNPLEDLSAVSWTYTARKVSENQFNYGESPKDSDGNYISQGITLFATSDKPKTTLTLSQGKWVFELFGRNDSGTLLYYGITGEVLILRSNGLNQITVEVSPYTSATGTLELSNIVVNLNTPVTIDGVETSTVAPNYLIVNGNEYSDFTGSKEITGLAADQYTVTVKFVSDEDGLTYAEETVVATVYSGRTTTVGGNLSEETGSGTIQGEYVDGNTSVVVGKVEEGKDLVLVSAVVPVDKTNNSEANTTVTFPAGAIDGSSAQLTVDVKGIDSNFEVSIPSGETVSTTPIASIDLSVKVGDTTVSSFNGKSVKVETYILKNLDSTKVKVSYNGEILTDSDYDPVTGKLTFTTNHFSKFDVLSNAVCYNADTNKGYSSLANALASSSSKIVLLKDVDLTDNTNPYIVYYFFGELEGNNHKITIGSASGGQYLFYYLGDNSCLKNLVVNFTGGESGISLYTNNDVSFEGIKIEGSLVFTGNCGPYVVYAQGNTSFLNCEMAASISGNGGSSNYNSAFVGYPLVAGKTFTFTDCKLSGSLECGTAGLFIGNNCRTYSDINIIVNNFSTVDGAVVRAINCYGSTSKGWPFNGVIAAWAEQVDVTLKINNAPVSTSSLISSKADYFGNIFVEGPKDPSLSMTKNDDGTFRITKATVETTKYVVSIGLYTTHTGAGGGSLRQYVIEEITPSDSTSFDTTIMDLKFVDSEWLENNPGATLDNETLPGYSIYTLDDISYYMIPESVNANVGGQPKAAMLYSVTAYNGNDVVASCVLSK